MILCAQHGWGDGKKVLTAAQAGHLQGVIVSPRDIRPQSISEYLESLRDAAPGPFLGFVDPQFYASTIPNARDRYLPEYPYYIPDLTHSDLIDPATIQSRVKEAILFQDSITADRILSPTVLFDGFADRWATVALSMAKASLSCHATLKETAPLLLSFAFDESALKDREGLDEFLTTITAWDCHGFYFIVQPKDPNYPTYIDDVVAANIMYLTFVLAELNDYEVHFGYMDFPGLLCHATGAYSTSTGWHHSLRRFSRARFEPSRGGRRGRPRYSSISLLNSILQNPELSAIYDVGLVNDVLSGTEYDSDFFEENPANVSWPDRQSHLHHWEVLSRLIDSVGAAKTVTKNLDALQTLIDGAFALYQELETEGIRFESATGNRNLKAWSSAVADFRARCSV